MAEAFRDSIQAPVQESRLHLFQPHLDAFRAELGDDAWNAAWREGKAMTLEQAIAYALEEGE